MSYETSCVFYIYEHWRGNIKDTASFNNTAWNENPFKIILITWLLQKYQYFMKKMCVFWDNSARKSPWNVVLYARS